MIAGLVRLGNKLDDHGKPSMTVDNMRRELVTLKARHSTANDNNQRGTEHE